MSEKRRGLGRGLGALIPSGDPAARQSGGRPVDVFFPGRDTAQPPAPPAEVPERPVSDAAGPSARDAEARDAAAGTGPEARSGSPEGESEDEGVETAATETAAVDSADVEAAVEELLRSVSDDSAASDGNGFTGNTSDDGLVAVPGTTFAELPVDSIRPNPRQPRSVFDEDELAELVHSITEIGVLQPIVVRPAEDADGEVRFELIMGERRWRATRMAGLDVIPAIIRSTADDDLLRDALLENLHRSQLNPLEEAAAYAQLLEDFGCTHDDLAQRIGRSRPQISNTIRLLRLPPQVQRRVAAGVLSAGHARALLGLEDSEAMERLAQRIVSEGLSVRAVEEVVALGDATTAPRPKRPRAGVHRQELADLASRLGDRFDTRVQIALGRSKGKVSIEFASVEDLNRIVALLAPDERGAFREG